MIGPPAAHDLGKKTLVLDLDETLVHSSFRPVPSPDYVIPVEIDGRIVDVYVLKRPFVDHFLRAVGQRFEVVVFTASLGKYADPLLDLLDRSGVVRWRLFREACYPYEGSYVKVRAGSFFQVVAAAAGLCVSFFPFHTVLHTHTPTFFLSFSLSTLSTGSAVHGASA